MCVFLPLRRFYGRLRLFLFSFAYVLFMLVKLFRESYKTSPIPSFTILLIDLSFGSVKIATLAKEK